MNRDKLKKHIRKNCEVKLYQHPEEIAIGDMIEHWLVSFGNVVKAFYTEHHARQFARALELNGTKYTLIHVR